MPTALPALRRTRLARIPVSLEACNTSCDFTLGVPHHANRSVRDEPSELPSRPGNLTKPEHRGVSENRLFRRSSGLAARSTCGPLPGFTAASDAT
jgi:hypothetical protein